MSRNQRIDPSSLPNFFVIGAMKAATTTLHALLHQHPQVFCTHPKETFFFSNDARFARGIEWYAHTYFHGAERYPARGESTTHYLYWSNKVAPRMAESYPDGQIGLIAVLRDPVARAYSHYWWDVSRGSESRSFEDALSLEAGRLADNHDQFECTSSTGFGYFRGGCYAALLEPFLERFPRDRLFFVLQEDLQERFAETMSALARFLQVDPAFAFEQVHLNPAVRQRNQLVHAIYQRMTQPFPLKGALKVLLPSSVRTRLRRLGRGMSLETFPYPPMDPSTEKALRERFAPDVERLARIIQRDLKAWLPT